MPPLNPANNQPHVHRRLATGSTRVFTITGTASCFEHRGSELHVCGSELHVSCNEPNFDPYFGSTQATKHTFNVFPATLSEPNTEAVENEGPLRRSAERAGAIVVGLARLGNGSVIVRTPPHQPSQLLPLRNILQNRCSYQSKRPPNWRSFTSLRFWRLSTAMFLNRVAGGSSPASPQPLVWLTPSGEQESVHVAILFLSE